MPNKDPNDPNEDLTSRLLFALNHPMRRLILTVLAREPTSASRLSRQFGISLSGVSYHLSTVLYSECNVVKVVDRIPRRGAMETVFALRPAAYVSVIRWPDLPEPLRSGLRGIALRRFVDAATAALEAESETPSNSSIYMGRPVAVDAKGKREVIEAAREFERKVNSIEERCCGLNPLDLHHLVTGVAAFEASPLTQDDA